MKINTKYSISDTVWFIKNNEVVRAKVSNVYVTINNNEDMSVIYELYNHNERFKESDLFINKEELLKSL